MVVLRPRRSSPSAAAAETVVTPSATTTGAQSVAAVATSPATPSLASATGKRPRKPRAAANKSRKKKTTRASSTRARLSPTVRGRSAPAVTAPSTVIAAPVSPETDHVVVAPPPAPVSSLQPDFPTDLLSEEFVAPSGPLAQPSPSTLENRLSMLSDQLSTLAATVSTLVAQSSSAGAHSNDAASTPLHGQDNLPQRSGIRLTNTPIANSGSPSLPVTAPANIIGLTSQGFPYPANRIKYNFYPPPEDVLTAHRLFQDLHSPGGIVYSPHSFALFLCSHMRDRYHVNAPVVMAIYSGRLGSRGASVMCFTEKQRATTLDTASTNTVVQLSFSAGAALPEVSRPPCTCMQDLEQATVGFCNFAERFWLPHGQQLAWALRHFVFERLRVDRNPSASVLRLTLNYVDLWLGDALEALASESARWWERYVQAVVTITPASPLWIADLVTVQQRSQHEQANVATGPTPSVPYQQRAPTSGTRQPSSMASRLPPHLAGLLPRNARNQEPCLRYFSGHGCPGGDRQCTRADCVHVWPTALHPDLLEWARDHFAPRRNSRPQARSRSNRA